MGTNTTLLVTGHLGFIGSAFCQMYQDRYDIAGVDFRGFGSMESNLAARVRDFHADISDARALRAVVDEVEPDAIVNFAAESHVDRSNADDSRFWITNVLGTRNLATEASRLGVRMVQVSTDEVYGDATGRAEPWTEESPLAPRNPYAVTKAAAEMLLRVYADGAQRLDVVVTRGANTVGPRQFPEKAVPKAVSCFLDGRPFPLFRTPARRMWLHVADHVAGIEAALGKGKRGEVYNLGPPAESEAVTGDVIERIRRRIGVGQIESVPDRAHYDLRYWISTAKARRELDWEAASDLDGTIESTVSWYLSNREWLTSANRRLAVMS